MLSKNLFDEKTLEVNFISDYLTVTTPLPQYLPYPRFLLDIDRELLSFTHEVDETLLREAADDVARRDKYLREEDGDGTLPIGQRVRHAVFGEGTVLDVDLNKGAHVIQFDGMGTPRSISLRAKLEKIGP